MQHIYEKLTEIFRDVLENDDLVLKAETTAHDVEEWDSLTHVELIFGIEKGFKIKFITSEIEGFKNVGDMVAAIARKTNA